VSITALRKLVAEREVPFILVVSDVEHVIGMIWPIRLELPMPPGALASDVMTSACTAAEFTSIRQVLLFMATAHLRWLPIIAPDGTPLGVLRDVEALRAWVASRPKPR
jgi:hypothetical protein